MAEPRVIFSPSERNAPPHAEPAGDCNPGQVIDVTVVLRRRTPSPPPEVEGSALSREEFERLYGADPADMQKVILFAQSNGLAVRSADPARRSIVLSGTIASVSAAFGATVRQYRQDGRTFRARTGSLSLPGNLEGVVEGVFGLDERPQARSRLRRAADVTTSYTPVEVARFYQFPQGVTGAGQTVAIIELGGGYRDSDLRAYFSALGINPGPRVEAVAVDGGKNAPTGDPNSDDGEVLLDIEIVGAIASGASLAVYFAPNTTRGFLDAITTAIHDSVRQPRIISISWGEAESGYTAQALQSFDQAFQDARLLGVTVCCASGDDGSNDNATDGLAHVDFPASSPNVLACGGTRIATSGVAITSEVVWNSGSGGGSTGGGVSETFPLPDYQAKAGVPPSANPSRFRGRGVPDVAGDADPATGYQVTVDGQSSVFGGTSAVAPLWAALLALINEGAARPAGFINARLYSNPSICRDILTGTNGAYAAAPGWDPCTGLGSPKGEALRKLLA